MSKYLTWPLHQWGFSAPVETNDERNNANEYNLVKNPNWQIADQLAFYKCGWRLELGSAKKQLQLHVSGQGRTWTCDLRIQSLAP